MRVVKLAGQRSAAADAAGCWRYLLDWRRTDVGRPADVAADRSWLSPEPAGKARSGAAGGGDAAERERGGEEEYEAPATPARRAHRSEEEAHATPEARSLRCSAVAEHWPALVAAFTARHAAAAAKARSKCASLAELRTLHGFRSCERRYARCPEPLCPHRL